MTDDAGTTTGTDATPELSRVMMTGHRPQHLTPPQRAWSQAMISRVAAQLAAAHGTQHCISGLALGADTWWALAGVAAGMRLHTYVPFEDQAKKWSPDDRALWAHLRTIAHRDVLVGGESYDVSMLHARNDAMLADADLVVALLRSDSSSGGTFSTVVKARKKSTPLLVLDPVGFAVHREGW